MKVYCDEYKQEKGIPNNGVPYFFLQQDYILLINATP